MKLNGSVVNFLGDSITEGVGVENVAENRFDNVLKASAGLKRANNYGVSGSRLAHQRQASEMPRFDLCFCGRAYDMDHEADAVVVFGGTNDYGHGDAPFGGDGDATPATYCGAVRFLMDTLRAEYPAAKIIFMTPCHRLGDAEPTHDVPGLVGKRPLEDYVNVIRAEAAKRDVALLDLFRDLPIDPNRPEDLAKYAPDGLHLNDAGHRVLAALLKDFLEKL